MVTRILSAALSLMLLTASPWTVCSRHKSRRPPPAAPPEPEPTGPTLDSLPADQGLLTLRFPDRPASTFVMVHMFTGGAQPSTFPTTFPIRIAVPLHTDGVVHANVGDDASFIEPFKLTPEHRHKEVVIRLIEQRWSESYGFHASELPKETGFVPLAAPRPGKPAASVFLERYEGLARHLVPTTLFSSWFLIDEQGDVWRAHRRWPSADIKSAPEPSFRQFGRLDPAVFERMKSLREDAAKGSLEPVERCGGCMGCGSSSISIHGVGFADKNGVTIASGRATCERSPGPAAKTIAAWMVALAKQVPHGR